LSLLDPAKTEGRKVILGKEEKEEKKGNALEYAEAR
jgi:hypothetical protein